MICLRLLIDDRVGKPGYTKQRGDPAHALGMTETNVAARPQAIIEIFRGEPARSFVEIYQDVAAENEIEIAILRHILGIDQIDPREFDGIPESFVDLVVAAGDRLEIAPDNIAGQPHQRAIAVDAFGGGLERAGVDIRSDDLDI